MVTRLWYEPHLDRIHEDSGTRHADLIQLEQIASGYPSRERFLTELTLDPPDATPDETRPLAFFAGIWTRWTSVRKVKEGETTNDIFAFLTTEPNKEVGAIHPKAMPVVLTAREEIDVWMNAPAEEALKLQKSLPDNSLKVVAKGDKKDEGGLAA
jgi:hypothetical protein